MTVMAPSFFMFIGVNRFRTRFRPNDLIVNNITIINNTQPVGNPERETVKVDGEERTIYSNKGPGVEPIEKATGETVTERPVQEVARETPPPENLPGNENQQRPEVKPGEQPGSETTLPPTGKEPQPEKAQPQPIQPEQPPAVIPPTGEEQQNKYQQPERPSVVTPPSTEEYNREQELNRLPPTGRPSVVTPPSTEEYNREQRPSMPQTPPQQQLPPTGRPGSQPPSQVTPSAPTPPPQSQPPAPNPPSQPPSVTPPPPSSGQNAPSQQLPPTGRPGGSTGTVPIHAFSADSSRPGSAFSTNSSASGGATGATADSTPAAAKTESGWKRELDAERHSTEKVTKRARQQRVLFCDLVDGPIPAIGSTPCDHSSF